MPRRGTGVTRCPTKCECCHPCATPKRKSASKPKRSSAPKPKRKTGPKRKMGPKRKTGPKRSKSTGRRGSKRAPKRASRKPQASHYSGQVAQSRETSQARKEMAYYFGDMAVYYAKLAKLMSD